VGKIQYPALYQSSDAVSLQAQRLFFGGLFAHLVCLVAAAIISVINSPSVEMAILQTVVLCGALGFASLLAIKRPERLWYSGRAVAESIKTITWRFMVRAEPFNNNEQADRRHFTQTLQSIVEQNKEVTQSLSTHLSGAQVTDQMVSVYRADLSLRQSLYLESRIKQQLDWYAKKAATNRKKSFWFFVALIAVNFLAILFALLKVKYPTAPFWPTDALLTIAAGVLAWSQAKRFGELASSYALAASEIGLIKEQSFIITTDDEFSKFVGDAENAFSREHTQWVARKDK
jgi:hypothetical protein